MVELDKQCQDMCVGKKGPSKLYVPLNNTKAILEDFKWGDVMQDMNVPTIKKEANQVPSLCTAYGILMHQRWRELSLIQNVMTIVLGIGHSTSKVLPNLN